MSIELLVDEQDRNVLAGRIRLNGQTIRFMTNFEIRVLRLEHLGGAEGLELLLTELHVYGEGANTLGLRILRDAVVTLGRQLGVSVVRVEGGERVSGASMGRAGAGPRKPRRLSFVVVES